MDHKNTLIKYPIWKLQEAKTKLTQLIKETNLEPQIIPRNDINETVVILSMEKYQRALITI